MMFKSDRGTILWDYRTSKITVCGVMTRVLENDPKSYMSGTSGINASAYIISCVLSRSLPFVTTTSLVSCSISVGFIRFIRPNGGEHHGGRERGEDGEGFVATLMGEIEGAVLC